MTNDDDGTQIKLIINENSSSKYTKSRTYRTNEKEEEEEEDMTKST